MSGMELLFGAAASAGGTAAAGTAAATAGAAAAGTAATSGLIGAGGAFSAVQALQTAGTILSLASAVNQASTYNKYGAAQDGAAQFRAAQLEQQAGQERASAQRTAMEARRRAKLAASRAQALSASSGAGALDPTVLKLMSGIAGEGELAADNALYQGEERAIGLQTSAAANRYEGSQARRAGEIRANTSILGGVASAAQGLARYAPGPSPTAAASNIASGYDGSWTEDGPFDSRAYDKQIWD